MDVLKKVCYFCILSSCAFAEEAPWFTGTLLSPPGVVTPVGHYEIEAYLYGTVGTGFYDAEWRRHATPHLNSLLFQVLCLIGLTERIDLQLTPQLFWNWSQGASSFHAGDLPIGLDFQLTPADGPGNFPGIKLTLRETFPTGHYQHLNPAQRGADLSGLGTFASTLNLVLYKIYSVGKHFLSTTYSAAYTVNSVVEVHGLNAYGGGHGTRGRVDPGDLFQAMASFEWTLTQNWVFALDNVYSHKNRDHFSGNPGTTSGGDAALVGLPSGEQISFAPALEYNFNVNLGICAGVWFTATGRNSARFTSGIFALDYSF